MSILDDPKRCAEIDPTGMLRWVENFPSLCEQGIELGQKAPLPPREKLQTLMNIVIAGMGGSAMGGDLVRSFAKPQCDYPIEVVRDYQIPDYAGVSSLVFACSFSGNTEETLSAYDKALEAGACLVGLTTGGKLLERCERDGTPCIQIPGGMSPRAALPLSWFSLIAYWARLELIDVAQTELDDLIQTARRCVEQYGGQVPLSSNPAKQLATQLVDKIPVMYASEGPFEPVARRWRAQFNENAKVFAHDMTVPEMNHNEILGWKNPASLLKHFYVICLRDQGDLRACSKRFEVMQPIIEPVAGGYATVASEGRHTLGRMVSLVMLGDFTSVYLAYLLGEDPVPIPAIDHFKAELGK